MDLHMLYTDNELTPELIEYAKNHLGETDEKRKKALQELKKLVEEDSQIDNIDGDLFFILALRIRKYDIQRALVHYHKCFKHLESHHNIFFCDNFDAARRFLKADIYGFMKYRDRNGRAIMYANPGAWDVAALPIMDAVFGGVVTVMHSCLNSVNQVAGYILIMNFENLQIKHITALLRWIVVAVFSVQKICPGFMKGAHVVYTSSLYKVLWETVKPLLGKKLKDRVHFHKMENLSTLYEFVPKEVLPPELGGSTSFSNDHWTEDFDTIVEQYKDLITKNRGKANTKE